MKTSHHINQDLYFIDQEEISKRINESAQIISQNLRIYRKFCDLSLEQVYELSGISKSKISEYERGKNMSLKTFETLIAFYKAFIEMYCEGYPEEIIPLWGW